MNIDQMPAGPEMDALVAEKVMDWKRLIAAFYKTDGTMEGDPPKSFLKKRNLPRQKFMIPRYSAEIESAWDVVEKTWPVVPDQKSGFLGFLQHSTGKWGVSYIYSDCSLMKTTTGESVILSLAETLPLAICRAALKAVL